MATEPGAQNMFPNPNQVVFMPRSNQTVTTVLTLHKIEMWTWSKSFNISVGYLKHRYKHFFLHFECLKSSQSLSLHTHTHTHTHTRSCQLKENVDRLVWKSVLNVSEGCTEAASWMGTLCTLKITVTTAQQSHIQACSTPQILQMTVPVLPQKEELKLLFHWGVLFF